MTRRLLVVAAHPDDEVLGCGGLVARTLREGGSATALILTEGCSTQYPDQPELIATKERQAAEAMGKLAMGRSAMGGLGAAVEFARLPDMQLSILPPAQVNAPVEEAVTRLRPDWVLVHHAHDLNRDHQVAHEAARIACRPGAAAPRLLTYETLSSTEWGSAPFVPALFVTLTEEDLDRKIEALRCYDTEVRPAPHPRSPETVRELARLRGAHSGVELAEAFGTVWERL